MNKLITLDNLDTYNKKINDLILQNKGIAEIKASEDPNNIANIINKDTIYVGLTSSSPSLSLTSYVVRSTNTISMNGGSNNMNFDIPEALGRMLVADEIVEGVNDTIPIAFDASYGYSENVHWTYSDGTIDDALKPAATTVGKFKVINIIPRPTKNSGVYVSKVTVFLTTNFLPDVSSFYPEIRFGVTSDEFANIMSLNLSKDEDNMLMEKDDGLFVKNNSMRQVNDLTNCKISFGELIQYTGETTDNYTKGHIYEIVRNGIKYKSYTASVNNGTWYVYVDPTNNGLFYGVNEVQDYSKYENSSEFKEIPESDIKRFTISYNSDTDSIDGYIGATRNVESDVYNRKYVDTYDTSSILGDQVTYSLSGTTLTITAK